MSLETRKKSDINSFQKPGVGCCCNCKRILCFKEENINDVYMFDLYFVYLW